MFILSVIILSNKHKSEGFDGYTYDGNVNINLPGDSNVNYNFMSFGANGVQSTSSVLPYLPPPQTHYWRVWLWYYYYYDASGNLHASGYWYYWTTNEYNYNYYGPSGNANYSVYHY